MIGTISGKMFKKQTLCSFNSVILTGCSNVNVIQAVPSPIVTIFSNKTMTYRKALRKNTVKLGVVGRIRVG